RARRADRRERASRRRHEISGDLAGTQRASVVRVTREEFMGRILVADDHDSLRRGIVRALSDAKHEVDEAPNGNVAIEKLHEGQYDVVLSDLKMGGSDGLDVLRTAKSLQPNTAVILMTAFGSIHTAVEAMKIGAF